MKFFEPYSVGICVACCCTNLPQNEIAEEMNKACPTGIRSKWEIDLSPVFADGHPNPNQCEQREDCKHFLLKC